MQPAESEGRGPRETVLLAGPGLWVLSGNGKRWLCPALWVPLGTGRGQPVSTPSAELFLGTR